MTLTAENKVLWEKP